MRIKYSCYLFLINFLLKGFFPISAAPLPVSGSERENPAENMIFEETIHSVRLFREGWEFSMPVFELGSDQHLLLRFDDVSVELKNYSYTITQCDFNWIPSGLMESEYLQGFHDNPVNNYRKSINTTIPYTSYSLSIPNENSRIRLSGNYILTVFEEGHPENPALIRRFYVVEPATKITGVVKNATYDSFKGPNQEVDFTVYYPGINIQDPRTEVKATVMQNFREDNAITNLKPLFVRDNQLIYDYGKENVFAGGNEFRNFDIKNLQTNGMGVTNIEFNAPFFHVSLETDLSRNGKSYLSEDDLNGEYLVKNDRANEPELESDYVMVHFSLQSPRNLPEGNLYIFGKLSDWKCLPQNKMDYNPDTNTYEGSLLLKQGFYDYQYVFIPKGGNKIDNTVIEGSHVETENDYQILVYYHGFSSRYDRLIGYQRINSVKK